MLRIGILWLGINNTGKNSMSTKYNDGVYDITNEQYHASEGISRSKLMLLDKSPYHFWYETLSGLAVKTEATPAMNIGSAFHTMLLEPAKFQMEFAVMPSVDRRTKGGKEMYEEFLIHAEGKIILTVEQFSKVSKMVDLISKHEIVTTLLDEAVYEQSIYWTDKETGLQFKTRPDIWSSKMVVDLKTTNNASAYSFMRSALDYGYYLQAGMAHEACKALDKPFDMFVILACEKEAPHVPAIYIMKDEALQFGINQFNTYKRKLKKCMDENKWEGYLVQELTVPNFAVSSLEEKAA
jgi:exodeoxyribonuclease VIII